MLTNSPCSAGLLLRLDGLGGGTGGCFAWGGTGGGVSEMPKDGSAREGLDGYSTIREIVLGGLAKATVEEEEEEDEEEEGLELLPGSVGAVEVHFGGSKACLAMGGSCV